MPKQKTHSAAKKRFKVTKNGKVRSGRKNTSHLLAKKNSNRKRRLSGYDQVTGADAKRVKRLLNR